MSDTTSSAGNGAIRVLICDDHPEMRAVLREILALRPSLQLVGEAANGEEALNQARQLQPDVIVLDLAMPKKTGYEVLLEFRVHVPLTRIVVFSAFSAASVASDVLERGAVSYLEKGATPDSINDTIEHAATLTPPPP